VDRISVAYFSVTCGNLPYAYDSAAGFALFVILRSATTKDLFSPFVLLVGGTGKMAKQMLHFVQHDTSCAAKAR
jgi:hypothetical protein